MNFVYPTPADNMTDAKADLLAAVAANHKTNYGAAINAMAKLDPTNSIIRDAADNLRDRQNVRKTVKTISTKTVAGIALVDFAKN